LTRSGVHFIGGHLGAFFTLKFRYRIRYDCKTPVQTLVKIPRGDYSHGNKKPAFICENGLFIVVEARRIELEAFEHDQVF
jgi:hypothetical protein